MSRASHSGSTHGHVQEIETLVIGGGQAVDAPVDNPTLAGVA